MAKKKKWIKISEYAKQAGMMSVSLHRMAREGKIPYKVIDGERHVDPKILDPVLNPKKGKPKKAKKSALTDENIDILEADRRKKVFEAKLKELQVREREGELISSDKVKKIVYEMVRKSRDSILSIPNRLSPELAAETDPFKVEQMLTKELKQALEHLILDLKNEKKK